MRTLGEKYTFIKKLWTMCFQKGLTHLFSANFLTQFLGFGSLVLVAKILSPTEIGTIKIIQSYIAVGAVFATLGYTTAIVKFCSAIKSLSVNRYILKRAVIASLKAGTFIAITICALSSGGFLTQNDLVREYLPLYSTIIVFNAVSAICLSYMQAGKNFKKAAIIQSQLKVVSFFALIAGAYFSGIQGYMYSVVTMSVLSMIPLIRSAGVSFVFQEEVDLPPQFYTLVNSSIAASAIGVLGQYTDIFFLDHCLDDRNLIGFYALATVFLLAGVQVTGTVQSFLTPYFSEKIFDGAWLWQNWKKYQLYLAGAMVPVCLVTFLGACLLVKVYYGPAYEGMLPILGVLLFQVFFRSWYAVSAIILIALNKVQYNCAMAVFYLILKSALCYGLVGHYGIWGIVAAQVLTEIPTVILHYFVTYRVFCAHFGKGNF